MHVTLPYTLLKVNNIYFSCKISPRYFVKYNVTSNKIVPCILLPVCNTAMKEDQKLIQCCIYLHISWVIQTCLLFLTAEAKDSFPTAFWKAFICNFSLEGHRPFFLTGQTLSTKSCVVAQATAKTESKYSMMAEMQVSDFYSISVAPVLLLAIISALLQHLFLHFLLIFRAWLTNGDFSQMLRNWSHDLFVDISFIQIIHKYKLHKDLNCRRHFKGKSCSIDYKHPSPPR